MVVAVAVAVVNVSSFLFAAFVFRRRVFWPFWPKDLIVDYLISVLFVNDFFVCLKCFAAGCVLAVLNVSGGNWNCCARVLCCVAACVLVDFIILLDDDDFLILWGNVRAARV